MCCACSSHRGITPSASGAEDTQTDGDDEDTVDAPRTNTPELIIGTNGPAQVSIYLKKVKVFHAHMAAVSVDLLSRACWVIFCDSLVPSTSILIGGQI